MYLRLITKQNNTRMSKHLACASHGGHGAISIVIPPSYSKTFRKYEYAIIVLNFRAVVG